MQVTTKEISKAGDVLKNVVVRTPLQYNEALSKKYGANVYLKREDLQAVRSYKLRGAYNKMHSLTLTKRKRGVVCASAGNHAQGVAYSANKLKVKSTIFMPRNTTKQKIDRVREFGGSWVNIELVGDTYDDAYAESKLFEKKKKAVFVHPFNDSLVIAGQGTVAKEVLEDSDKPIDFMLLPIGGGGLASGVSIYMKDISPRTKLIGVEPFGAPSMKESIEQGKVVTLDKINKFVDGASVKTVGENTFKICQKNLDGIVLVPEGRVCVEMISLYQDHGIVTEPAGALSISALDFIKDKIKGKTVVCVVSGGNNDISRYQEVIERSLVYKGLKHYFIIEFSQRPGALKMFLEKALGPSDDVTLFEYTKKNNRETGPALVGVELSKTEDLKKLTNNMDKLGIKYEKLDPEGVMFKFII